MSDWVDGLLADVCVTIRAGGTPQTDNQNFYGGGIPFVTIEDISSVGRTIETTARTLTAAGLNASAAWLVPPDHLLYSMYATLGKVTRNTVSVATNQAILAIKPDEKLIACDLLFYLLQFMESSVASLSSQTTQANLSADKVRKFKLKFPKSLPQQLRIAEILSTLDEAIEQTETLIAKHQQIKAGLMHDLFTRGVTLDGHLRPSREQAPDLYKDSPLGWIPKEWEIAPLLSFSTSRLGGFVNGPFGSDLLTSELTDSGVVVIYVQDIKGDGYIRVSNAYVTEEKANELLVCNVRLGDVLVAKVGDPPGIAAAYTEEQRAVVTQDVIRIRPADDAVTQFLAGLLNATVGSRAIRRITIEGTRARVSLTEFKCLLLPKPTSKEQQVIADKMSAAQQVLSAFTFELRKLKTQKHGLMHDLLADRVRVPEPTHVTV